MIIKILLQKLRMGARTLGGLMSNVWSLLIPSLASCSFHALRESIAARAATVSTRRDKFIHSSSSSPLPFTLSRSSQSATFLPSFQVISTRFWSFRGRDSVLFLSKDFDFFVFSSLIPLFDAPNSLPLIVYDQTLVCDLNNKQNQSKSHLNLLQCYSGRTKAYCNLLSKAASWRTISSLFPDKLLA